ncbi:MAG: TPM domain-containing protein [Chitinophagaceae bacterium]
MKKLLSLLFLFFSIAAIAQNIPARPDPPRLVNDFAHVLTSDQIESLERKLVNYDDSTSTQIVIVTVPSTGDYDVDDYALKILRDWGVGNKKTNNGIVILAAINDRKVKIEVGYGMEGSVPDITAKQIIDNEITPNFRQNNYYRGFDEAASAIIRAASGEYKAPQGYRKPTKSGRGGSILSFLIPLIIILVLISRSGGGGGGGMISRRGSNPFLGGLLGGIIGSSLGRGGGGWSGGGGGWSGGGGGGGGGFGGFGGGSGGGGGASGSW